MKINDSCISCKECLPYCPQGAIFMNDEELAVVNRDVCVECGVCIDSDICPVSAFEEDHDEIAEFKRPFGRLLWKHLDTKNAAMGGRYDVKTNDVTSKLPEKEVAMRLEINRPGGNLKFIDAEKLRTALEIMGWQTAISNRSQGLAEKEFGAIAYDQRILSCHLELVLTPQDVSDVVKAVTAYLADKELWVSINVAGVAETIAHTEKILQESDIYVEPVAKVNLGLGKKG